MSSATSTTSPTATSSPLSSLPSPPSNLSPNVSEATSPHSHPPFRLSIPPTFRILLITTLSSTLGFGLGLTHGATLAGLRFRAENAHRLPDTRAGWYLYHKSKNYAAMWGGVREGGRMALRVGVWTGAFVLAEEAVDGGRGRRDGFSSVVAGLGTAAAFSAWNRFPLPTAARTARLGLLVGLGFGVLQDGVAVMKGERVGYVDWVMGWRRRRRKLDMDTI
ncbi:MAG: hypothetical protein M1821_001925 [Bathelium mastoideum]|nr:MAG: hypothetical protein M1821_001925 [Bathelium mastoideum]KAI9692434.1 MAG: hypothetical protein M1822_006665 [Bathelium mastoideum]